MPITATDLLRLSARELDALFASGTTGPAPTGVGAGTAILAPSTRLAGPLATVTRAVAWQGKELAADGRSLRNLLSPLGLRAVRASVYEGPSRIDGGPCLVLDYSSTSKLATWVRDEIRLVGPGLYLGVVYVRSRRLRLWFALQFDDAGRRDESEPGDHRQRVPARS